MKPRKKKPLRLGRLRRSVSLNNRLYGYLVTAHDALRGELLELSNRVQELEALAGLRFSRSKGRYIQVVHQDRPR